MLYLKKHYAKQKVLFIQKKKKCYNQTESFILVKKVS